MGPIHITLEGRGDLASRIYQQLHDAILDGRLRPGEKLPPSRELAQQLDVARNTVSVAYERLTAEGFLTARVGAGTFVGALAQKRSRKAPQGNDLRPRALWESMPTMQYVEPSTYDFRVGVPDWRLFPLETWRRLISAELRPAALRDADYRDPTGLPALKAAIARYIGISRSVRTAPDDVLVTQGAQQALDLIGRVLIEPGTCVAVEDPGYPPARRLFQSLGAEVVGVPVDSEGLDVAAIPKAAKLVYVTPSHQFPLGTPMSLARRTALLGWAQRRQAVIIEDDYDSEFRFSDRPLEPLQSLDRSGRVIYVGSFSKTMVPMLRIGFLIAPASLQSALRTAKQLADWRGDLITQGALARFLDEGMLARHIRKATRIYSARQELIVETLRRDFDDWLEVVPSAAGLHLCALLRPEASYVPVPGIETLDRYCVETVHNGLVIGYGGIQLEEITPGLRRVRRGFTR
ncbi:MAG TPA: GntR family transcriptional regulator [Micromonosporaceae bacterium]|nr:GntR family transcriptional regulator [Micromonosporaceae bacterium]